MSLKIIRVERIVPASSETVWKVIADLESFHEVAPNLHYVRILAGHQLGAVRQCTDKNGKSWTEKCILWNEGHSFTFEVNTGAKDYPFPFKQLRGTFTVEELDSTVSRIIVLFEYEYKFKFLMAIIAPLARKSAHKMLTGLLLNWERSILQTVNN